MNLLCDRCGQRTATRQRVFRYDTYECPCGWFQVEEDYEDRIGLPLLNVGLSMEERDDD